MSSERFAAPPQAKAMPTIPQDRPAYRILNEQGFFGPDHALYGEGEMIVFDDVPNEDMEPLNDLARVALDKYLDSLEESAKLVAEKNGRSYSGRARTKSEMLEFAAQDARRAKVVGNEGGVPIMGAKRRGRPRIKRIGETQTPDMTAADEAQIARSAKVGKLS